MRPVSRDVGLTRPSHSNLILNFRLLGIRPFRDVPHVPRETFRPSDSNRVAVFHLLDISHFRNARRFHQFAFHCRSTGSVKSVSHDVGLFRRYHQISVGTFVDFSGGCLGLFITFCNLHSTVRETHSGAVFRWTSVSFDGAIRIGVETVGCCGQRI